MSWIKEDMEESKRLSKESMMILIKKYNISSFDQTHLWTIQNESIVRGMNYERDNKEWENE